MLDDWVSFGSSDFFVPGKGSVERKSLEAYAFGYLGTTVAYILILKPAIKQYLPL